ncbi:hypothetical protein [Leptospira interrogans]|nr:hypothetical protein [Leptospira interrogans]
MIERKKFIKNDKSQNETESVGTTANPDFTDKLPKAQTYFK